MSGTPEALFVRLSYHLERVRNVVVLMYLLERQADLQEAKTTSAMIATHGLHGALTYREVRNAINDLIELGLVTTRVHPNTRTHFTVHRDAVLQLLAKPLPHDLPGVRQSSYPFLDAWRAASVAADETTDLAGPAPSTPSTPPITSETS